ncbi:MAG: hypothetical protein PHX74_11765 [Candidatus Sumerlaeales bacterium]|nr:hypothetical protein [Candidatus Sumerlaeales bacterium]
MKLSLKETLIQTAAILAIAILAPANATADHALESKGTGLFNVIVEDNVPTGTKNMRVRFTDTSFALTYKTKTLRPLLGRANYYDIVDHITTATRVGKDAAIKLMEDKEWSKYTPTPPPTPKPATTSTIETRMAASELNSPYGRLLSTFNKPFLIPIDSSHTEEEQITSQLNAFIQQQQMAVTQINSYLRIGMLTLAQGTELRKSILEMQLKAFKDTYKQDTENVRKAMKFFDVQIKSLNERGFYNYE